MSNRDAGHAQSRRIVMHVNFAGAEQLSYVLNNVENIHDYYSKKPDDLEIRIVCHGPGLHMLREDSSPVKERLVRIVHSMAALRVFACSNTIERMANAEGRKPVLIDAAKLVEAGLPEIIELQQAGWTYLKP